MELGNFIKNTKDIEMFVNSWSLQSLVKECDVIIVQVTILRSLQRQFSIFGNSELIPFPKQRYRSRNWRRNYGRGRTDSYVISKRSA